MATNYRADIDGLRAVAVVPVVLFHAGMPILTGGFVGVDIFFVISGYLITSIILPDIDAKRFSITTFYERRARRIFPALAVVLFFCAVAGFVLLTPSDYKTLGESILATTLFVSNIFFWRQTDYFAAPASESPLLHTWSLSIEEQFYVFYPWLLILVSRRPRARILALSIICLVSFGVGAVLVYYKPSATFYLGPTRAWELALGGMIALACSSGYRLTKLNDSAAWLGVALIAVPMIAYSASTRFPGIAALPPALGAALIIWSGHSKQGIVHNLLSCAAFTAIGKASYSLYLWHFPLIAFTSYVDLFGLSWTTKAGLCLGSLLISFLSLRYVERPFRLPSKVAGLRRPAPVALAGMAMACVAGLLIAVGSGFPSRLDATSAAYLDTETDKNRHHMECMSLENRIVSPSQACKLGATREPAHVLVWGDSHAIVTGSAIAEAAERNNASVLLVASVDCPIGIGFGIDPRLGSDLAANPGYQHCQAYNEEMLRFVEASSDISTVVLSSRWTNWKVGELGSASEKPVDIRLRDADGTAETPEANKRIFVRGFETLLKALTAAQKTVWIVGPIPEPPFRIPKALFIEHVGFDRTELDVRLLDFENRNKFIFSVLAEAKQRFPVHVIWPHLALCDDTKCPVSSDGKPIFFDDNHMSLVGAHQTSFLYDRIFTMK
ncbi:acyltransferase family protein [Bradyrhizobium sp. HKCCYLS1011]|uniref:acyltransferase family protein n=1 Tax=Bradyrhizobium sp. HKCCYLS1011 TaxID=3420733 RepID=UPI003EBD6F7C